MRLLLLLLLALPALAESPFHFKQVSASSFELSENGQPVYVYNFGDMLPAGVPEDRRRCCYLHPVYAPNGVVVTDDFPKDHYHHRGIFWTWPVVTIAGKEYSLWDIRGIRARFERWVRRETTPESAELAFENGWYTGGKRVVREAVRIVAHPAVNGRRELDFTLSFEAVGVPVSLRGAPTNNKGYGGFSVRFAPREQTRVTTDAGVERKDSNMVPHPWAQEEGLFAKGRAGLRIDIDPSNPGYPNGWCLRHYGFLGVNYPGNDTLTLEPGKPLVLRYKVTVFAP